ncbi:MAG: type II toxin-antitoxin system HicB family antitoxin [Bryobacteraceae bacterium]|jgi:predicted RNase H-like HicB family nuclease
MLRQVKIIVEKHPDGYVAYPLGLKGTVVGEGGTYEEALADVKSAIEFHIETFGSEVLPEESPVLEAFIAEATIPA